jgi:hypothetical protein
MPALRTHTTSPDLPVQDLAVFDRTAAFLDPEAVFGSRSEL